MKKRPAGILTPAQTRKRKRNGISSSRAMLDSLEAPASIQGMRVWHSNIEEPRLVHESVITLQPDVSTSTVKQDGPALYEDSGMPTAEPTRRRKRGRKKENDSVSPQPVSVSAGSIICFVDKNVGLAQTSDAGSRRTITARWPPGAYLTSLLQLPRRPWHTQVSGLQCCLLILCHLHRFPSQ